MTTQKLCIIFTLALLFTFALAVKNNPTDNQDDTNTNTRFQNLKQALQMKQKKINIQNHDLTDILKKKKTKEPVVQANSAHKNFYAQFVYNPPVEAPKKAKASPSSTSTPSQTISPTRPKKRTHSHTPTPSQTISPTRPRKRTHSRTPTETQTPTPSATPSHPKKKGKVSATPSHTHPPNKIEAHANTPTTVTNNEAAPFVYFYDYDDAPKISLPNGSGNQGQPQKGKAKPARLRNKLLFKL